MLASCTALRRETNLRVSTILGLACGGGLGQVICNNVQLGFYSRLSTLLALIYLLVVASDWVGATVSRDPQGAWDADTRHSTISGCRTLHFLFEDAPREAPF